MENTITIAVPIIIIAVLLLPTLLHEKRAIGPKMLYSCFIFFFAATQVVLAFELEDRYIVRTGDEGYVFSDFEEEWRHKVGDSCWEEYSYVELTLTYSDLGWWNDDMEPDFGWINCNHYIELGGFLLEYWNGVKRYETTNYLFQATFDESFEDDDCCKQNEGQCCPSGQPKCPNSKVGNPISIMSGNNEETETDLQFSTPHERGFKLYRTYKSRSDNISPLGYGWTHNYNVVLNAYNGDVNNVYQITDESDRIHNFRDYEGDGIYIGIQSTKGHLVEDTDGSLIWYRGNGVTYTFNSGLKLVSKTDGNGNVQILAYNTDGLLETVTDESTGRSIGFIYNADGRIENVTGFVTNAVTNGIWVTYQYDIEDNLTRVIYADDDNGSTASGFEYKYEDTNDVHNLTEKRNLAGEFLASWAYDATDRTYENVTRDGKGVDIAYGSNQVVVTDAQGIDTIYTLAVINGRKTITNVTGGSGCSSCGSDDVVRYGYDDERRVNEIEYSNGRIDRYEDFDGSNYYHTEIQAIGTSDQRTFIYTYHPDTGDRLSITEESVLGSGNKVTIFDYDDDGNGIPNENPTRLMYRKIETGFTYDADGIVNSYEYITTYVYDTSGNVTEIDGPLYGNQDKVTYTYDANTGDRLTETRPLVGTTYYTYDAAGNVMTVTDPGGVVTTFTYDGRNRVVSTTRNGITASSTYTAAGEIDNTTDALGRTIDYAYNSTGFMENIVDPSGNFIYYGYDSLGQQTETSVYDSGSTQTQYSGTDYGDPANNPDLPSGKPWKTLRRNADDTADLETVYAYDSSGNIKSVTDANGNITRYEYDIFNRLTTVIQPGNITTTYTYDQQGNLSSVTDAEGHLTLYVYDDMGRVVSTDSPDTGLTLYNYDSTGNLRFKTQNNNTIEYQYDILGRLTNIIYSDTTQNVTITYDSGTGSNLLGRVASVTDPSGLLEYSYDVDGNVLMETRTINSIPFVTEYDYDDAGNLRSITYPTGHTIEYTADAVDPALIDGVILDPSGINQTLASGIAYKPFGPVNAMTLGNGITVSKTFDKSYQLLSLSSGMILNRSYTPDNVGNIEIITDNLDSTRSQSFGYDDLYRLTDASGIYGTIAYTYDNVGNRLSRVRTGSSPSEDTYYYYPDTNRLKVVVGDHAELIQYDSEGNTIQRLPGAGNPQPPIDDPADYIYNNAGQRIIKETTTDVIYHYDLSGQLIAETDNSGNMLKAYVWLSGQPLAMIAADGSIYYFHNDHLGTPQKLTDSTGAIVWAADYLPFGRADVNIATIDNNLRFAGQYYDQETGLHYNYNRYYDPSLGRYVRADPIGINGGINLYAYTANRPITSTDPFGLSCLTEDFGGGFGVEAHALGGGGIDVNTCCDKDNKRWIVVTAKACLGVGLGWSIGPNVQGSSNKDNCPDGYAGFSFEVGAGPFEAGISISDKPIFAYGVTYGIGGKFTVCHTWVIYKKQKGCCDNGNWY